MKICPKCNFENPDEISFCLVCKFEFEVQCPRCGSWKIAPYSKPFSFVQDSKCLDCGYLFSKADILEKKRTQRVEGTTKRFSEFQQRQQEIIEEGLQGQDTKTAARENLKSVLSDFGSRTKENFLKPAAEEIKISNDPQWQTKARIYKAKEILSRKIPDKIFTVVIAFLGFLVFLITRNILTTMIFLLVGVLIYVIFFRKKAV